MTKTRLGIAILIGTFIFLVGCQSLPRLSRADRAAMPTEPPSTLAPSSANGPLTGGTLTVRLPEAIGVINPLSANLSMRKVSPLLFSGLMRLDAQLRPVPDLAETWSSSPDGMTWTFRLRPGVQWHDGTTFSADDVLFTYRALIDAPVGGGQPVDGDPVSVAQADFQQVLENAEALDPYTIRITLRRPFAPLLADLTVPVLPRHLLRDTVGVELWQRSVSVGTGPFRLAEQRADGMLTLNSFSKYYLGPPNLARVTFVAIADEGEVARALLDGRVDVAEVSAEAAVHLADSPTVAVYSYPDLTFYYLGFNLRPGQLFADKTLRQSLSYAVDKAQVVQQSLGVRVNPIWSDIPAFSWAYDAETPRSSRDLQKVHQLLSADGWQRGAEDGVWQKDGRKFGFDMMVRQDAPERVRVAQMIADQAREAGIDARVVPADFQSTMAAARRPPFDFTAQLMGWTVGYDPDDYYLFHSSQIPRPDRLTGENYVGFRNEEFDRLSVEARAATDWQRRAELYRQTQRILAGELPYLFLWADTVNIAVSRRLIGLPDRISPTIWDSVASWGFSGR